MSENTPGLWDRMSKFLRKGNNIQLAIVAVAAVALIIFICTTISWPGSGGQQNANGGAAASQNDTGESLEDRLEKILAQVENAGAVKVLVTYETGPEIVPAVKTDTQKTTSEGAGAAGQGSNTTSTTENQEPVTVQGKDGTQPMVLVQKEPVILGVLVVAEGASDLEVRLNLLQAVQVALQIPADRIEVLPMK